jgi:hypothetical protein
MTFSMTAINDQRVLLPALIYKIKRCNQNDIKDLKVTLNFFGVQNKVIFYYIIK